MDDALFLQTSYLTTFLLTNNSIHAITSPENLKVAEGTVIVTREAKLDTHWMVPEEKVGVHLYVKDYSIQADGAAIQPNLKSVSFTDEVRSWLNELERHLR